MNNKTIEVLIKELLFLLKNDSKDIIVLEKINDNEYLIITKKMNNLGIYILYKDDSFYINYKNKLKIDNSDGYDKWDLNVLEIIKIISNINNLTIKNNTIKYNIIEIIKNIIN